MSFANTFISLSDVDITTLTAGKFLRVRPSGNLEVSQYDITTDTLTDVETTGSYTPSVGQSLVYTAAGKWRPSTLDVYAAGNGISKAGLTLNVLAGTDGGLVSNTSGVFIADVTDAANVAATHGNATHTPVITVNSKGQITGVTPTEITVTAASSLSADYINSIAGTSGQITVTGGTGNKANATLNLVATGVTAGVYGNTTHAPRITVDTYGRISSVDTVAVSGSGGSGNASLGFANIIVAGQTTVSAETLEDNLTLVAGSGMTITTNAAADTITLSSSGGGGGGAADQTLSVAGNVITISGNNDTVDLTTMLAPYSKTDTDAQDLTLSGNIISLTGQSGNVDLTSILGSSFSTADVDTHLNQSDPTSGYILSWNGSDYAWIANSGATGPTGPQGPAGSDGADGSGDVNQTLSASGNVITISGNNDTVDLTTMLAPYSKTDTDAQDLTLAGNVISLSGQSGNVDLTSVLGAYGGGITSVLADTTPQLGGDLDINGKDIVTTSNGNIDLDPNGSGKVVFKGNATKGSGQFVLNCENNSHGITIKGPPHSASADYTLVLPNDDGSANQVLKTDGSGNLAWVNQSGGGGGAAITVQDEGGNLSTSAEIINFAGAGVTATGTGATKTITIPGGSGVALVQRFKLNYNAAGELASTSDKTNLIDSISIDSATGGDVTVNFNSAVNYPPASIMMYGYDYGNNKYALAPLETTMALREIAGGGVAGSPTLFDGSATIALKLRLREGETGASRHFGSVTHAWIEFVVYD